VLLAGHAVAADPAAKPRPPSPAPPASATPAATAVEAISPDAARAGDDDDQRVRTLEARVSELKERISRTRARLLELQDRVVGGELGSGARVVVVHRNEMGGSFALESVAYALDGTPVLARADQGGDLDKQGELQVFAGRVAPGPHQLAVKLTYRGRGAGLFGSAEGWRFKVQSSHQFSVEPGKVTTVRAVGFEQGGRGVDLKDRPSVRYELDVKDEVPPKATAAAGPAAAPATPGGAAR
jgi:hypothetical protein